MDSLTQLTIKIIKSQREIIGPLAIDLANHVNGLKVQSDEDVSLTGDPKIIVSNLVNEYAHLFGQASVEVCKDAVREIKPPVPLSELPDVLK